jgi:hypothetical protein
MAPVKLTAFETGLKAAVATASRLEDELKESAQANGRSYAEELERYGMGISGLDGPPLLERLGSLRVRLRAVGGRHEHASPSQTNAPDP